MIIRKFSERDATGVCMLVSKTFNEFVSPDFTKHGTKKFLGILLPEKQIERAKTRDVFVAVHKGRITGMIEADGKDKITMLFIDKKFHGIGIAKSLVARIESLYKARSAKIRVFSSLYAVDFYRKMGFKKSTGIKRKSGFVYQPMIKMLRKRKRKTA